MRGGGEERVWGEKEPGRRGMEMGKVGRRDNGDDDRWGTTGKRGVYCLGKLFSECARDSKTDTMYSINTVQDMIL